MFKIGVIDGNSRVGVFNTKHGPFNTPNFMPVATQATVKGLDCERIKETQAEVVLVNTYHLSLRPGSARIQELGGIHSFMGWAGPILSDSGGFQVYSLQKIRKLTDEGVEFASHLDGSAQFLSPERAVQIQEELGVDIAMVLDECPSAERDHASIAASWKRTLSWAKRCLNARKRDDMALFGITQGAIFKDLRTVSASELAQCNFDGFAIGGLSVGEPKQQMYEVLSYHPQQLPANKIRYLMGVGTPEDIVEAVSQGVDLFDCVMPTRAGRFGRAFVSGPEPFINIKNSRFAADKSALDANCKCLTCRNYSKAYLNHLFKADEMLGPQALSLHNLTHYMALMRRIRESIAQNKFSELYIDEKRRWANREGEPSITE